MDKGTFILISLMVLMGIFSLGWADTIPSDVFFESYEAHRAWLAMAVGIRNDERITDLVPSVKEIASSVWQPFLFYVIHPDDITKCKSGEDVIDKLKIHGYRAPILLGDEIVGYSTIKLTINEETGSERWKIYGFGSVSDSGIESHFYSLLEEYPEDLGYKVFIFGIEYPSRPFVLIRFPDSCFYIQPVTNNSTIYLEQYTDVDLDRELMQLDQVLLWLNRKENFD